MVDWGIQRGVLDRCTLGHGDRQQMDCLCLKLWGLQTRRAMGQGKRRRG